MKKPEFLITKMDKKVGIVHYKKDSEIDGYGEYTTDKGKAKIYNRKGSEFMLLL